MTLRNIILNSKITPQGPSFSATDNTVIAEDSNRDKPQVTDLPLMTLAVAPPALGAGFLSFDISSLHMPGLYMIITFFATCCGCLANKVREKYSDLSHGFSCIF